MATKEGKRKYVDENGVCIVSGERGVDLHHIKARGMGGRHNAVLDEDWNLMPLRHKFHVEVEQIGLSSFVRKYPQVRQWLTEKGWKFDPVFFKWTHERKFK